MYTYTDLHSELLIPGLWVESVGSQALPELLILGLWEESDGSQVCSPCDRSPSRSQDDSTWSARPPGLLSPTDTAAVGVGVVGEDRDLILRR